MLHFRYFFYCFSDLSYSSHWSLDSFYSISMVPCAAILAGCRKTIFLLAVSHVTLCATDKNSFLLIHNVLLGATSNAVV